MFSVVTKYHKGRHSLFLYNLEIFCAFTQDILRSRFFYNPNYENASASAKLMWDRHIDIQYSQRSAIVIPYIKALVTCYFWPLVILYIRHKEHES